MLFGFLLSALGVVDIGVESGSFADSLLVAVAAQAFLGERLIDPIVQVSASESRCVRTCMYSWCALTWCRTAAAFRGAGFSARALPE